LIFAFTPSPVFLSFLICRRFPLYLFPPHDAVNALTLMSLSFLWLGVLAPSEFFFMRGLVGYTNGVGWVPPLADTDPRGAPCLIESDLLPFFWGCLVLLSLTPGREVIKTPFVTRPYFSGIPPFFFFYSSSRRSHLPFGFRMRAPIPTDMKPPFSLVSPGRFSAFFHFVRRVILLSCFFFRIPRTYPPSQHPLPPSLIHFNPVADSLISLPPRARFQY